MFSDLQKINRYLGVIVFSILILGAIVFYQERMCFLDNAFQSFLLINDGYPRVMTNRWPAVVMRLLPWAGLKMNLSLSSILILFSISYPLFQLICWWIVSYVYKRADLGILMICLLTLGVSDTFYWCPSDLTQAILLLICTYAILEKSTVHIRDYVLISLFSFASLFFHPLGLLAIGFMIIYKCINTWTIDRRQVLYLSLFTALWFIKSRYMTNWYDIAKQQEFLDNLSAYSMSTLPINHIFMEEIFTKYYLIAAALIVQFVISFIQKRLLPLLFVISSIVFSIILIHFANPQGIHSFYVEANYQLLTIFTILPLIIFFYQSNWTRYFNIGLCICMIVSILRIISYSQNYTERIKDIISITKTSCSKQIISENDLESKLYKMTWALSVESLIISSIKGKQKTLSLRVVDQNERQFIGPFKEYHIEELNQDYFILSNEHYCN